MVLTKIILCYTIIVTTVGRKIVRKYNSRYNMRTQRDKLIGTAKKG